MVKSEIMKILTYRLYLEFVDELSKDVNNYITFYDIWKREAVIHKVIDEAQKNEDFVLTEGDEGYYYILLDERYENTLEKARKTVLQDLKAKQLKQEMKYKNSKEYKQAVAKAQLKKTWLEFKKESEKVAKKRFVRWCGCWCWNVWNIERTSRQKK